MKTLIVFLTIILSIEILHAATQLKKTVKPSGGDYTSLEACLNANEQNLVSNDKYLDIEIDGSWASADDTSITIHNYTTDSSHYINVYTTSDARHDGKWNTGRYRLVPTQGVSAHAIVVDAVNYVKIDGLQIQSGDPGYDGIRIVNQAAAAEICVSNIIIKSSWDGIALLSVNGVVKVWNCIVYDCHNSFWKTETNGGGTKYFYNNSAVDYAAYGYYVRYNAVFINNLAKSSTAGTNGFYCWDITGDFKNNSSSDATSGYFSGTGNKTNQTFTFVNENNDDFHIASNDSGSRDSGLNLSSDPYISFSNDIDGQSRTGTWDIGADEYMATSDNNLLPWKIIFIGD